jgi:hypothetical protein
MSRYTPTVAHKFHSDGTVKAFAGNSVIAFVNRHSPQFQEITRTQDRLRRLSFDQKLAFLPANSFHMTVIDLLCDQVRDVAHWSTKLPPHVPIEEATSFMKDRINELPGCEPFMMAYDSFEIRDVCVLNLRPVDKTSSAILSAYRDQVANVTGVRLPNHDSYRFHITLAYTVGELQDEEEREAAAVIDEIHSRLADSFGSFEADQPMFCTFLDMAAFTPVNGERDRREHCHA